MLQISSVSLTVVCLDGVKNVCVFVCRCVWVCDRKPHVVGVLGLKSRFVPVIEFFLQRYSLKGRFPTSTFLEGFFEETVSASAVMTTVHH